MHSLHVLVGFVNIALFSVAGTEAWKKMSKTQAHAEALKPMEPSGSEIHFIYSPLSIPYEQLL